jgi:hypothetical protein
MMAAMEFSPAPLRDLITGGGLHRLEEQTKDEVVREFRKAWLPCLEALLAEEDLDLMERAWLMGEIRRLRRALGITQSPEERRARTRERVRALRMRQKATA